MTVDSTSQACLQLKDADTWSRNVSSLSGAGTVTTLATLLTDMSETAVALTSSTHPPVVGYNSGMRWSSADMASTDWTPQGLTTGSSGSTDFAIVSWHSKDGNSSRVSIIDTTDLSQAKYRNVILVNPTGPGTYEPVALHVGGLALEGHCRRSTPVPSPPLGATERRSPILVNPSSPGRAKTHGPRAPCCSPASTADRPLLETRPRRTRTASAPTT